MSKLENLKVKRPRVNWKKVLDDIEDISIWLDAQNYFYHLKSLCHRDDNFIAYQTLRHYYSSDRLEYLRWCVYGEVDVILR